MNIYLSNSKQGITIQQRNTHKHNLTRWNTSYDSKQSFVVTQNYSWCKQTRETLEKEKVAVTVIPQIDINQIGDKEGHYPLLCILITPWDCVNMIKSAWLHYTISRAPCTQPNMERAWKGGAHKETW